MNKQNKFLLAAFAFFGVALLTLETITPLAFIALGGMGWAIWRGQLWEMRE